MYKQISITISISVFRIHNILLPYLAGALTAPKIWGGARMYKGIKGWSGYTPLGRLTCCDVSVLNIDFLTELTQLEMK